MRSDKHFYIAEVADLPWPHDLFRCEYTDLFDATIRGVAADRPEDGQPLVEVVARGLSRRQLGLCPYHQADWPTASKMAIDSWSNRRGDGLAEIIETLARAGVPEETSSAARSFFVEPVYLDGPLLGNGQHRMCAMKLAGVERCLVES